MKTSSILILAALFFGAVLFFPFSFETGSSLVFVTGFGCIVANDLVRSRKSAGRHRPGRAFRSRIQRRPAPVFELAA